MVFRSEGRQVLTVNNTNIRDIAVRHVRINVPALFKVFKHFPYHVARLPRTLLAEDKYKAVRITKSAGIKDKAENKTEQSK